jgi:hypothetical protein
MITSWCFTLSDAGFLDEHPDVVAGEFTGRPGSHDREAFGVFDQQPGRNPTPLDSPETIK